MGGRRDIEFRQHLKEFEKAAGGATKTEPASDAAMPPSAATASTANPATPTAAASGSAAADPARPTSSGAVGTSGSTSADPTATMTPTDRENASAAVNTAEAQKELDAISAILDKSKTGTLTKAQTTELKKHVEILRALLNQK